MQKFVFLPFDYWLPAQIVTLAREAQLPTWAAVRYPDGNHVTGNLLLISDESERPTSRVADGPLWR